MNRKSAPILISSTIEGLFDAVVRSAPQGSPVPTFVPPDKLSDALLSDTGPIACVLGDPAVIARPARLKWNIINKITKSQGRLGKAEPSLWVHGTFAGVEPLIAELSDAVREAAEAAAGEQGCRRGAAEKALEGDADSAAAPSDASAALNEAGDDATPNHARSIPTTNDAGGSPSGITTLNDAGESPSGNTTLHDARSGATPKNDARSGATPKNDARSNPTPNDARPDTRSIPTPNDARSLAVSRTGGVMAPQMLEYAAMHILASERRLSILQGGQVSSRGCQERGAGTGPAVWHALRETCAPRRSLVGVRAAVLGYGDLGAHVAHGLSSAFGMDVAALSRRAREGEQGDDGAAKVRVRVTTDPAAALRGAEYVVNLLPSTAETRFAMDAWLKRDLFDTRACFINAGRGDVCSRDALLDALNEGALGSAVLDVFESEPLADDDPFLNHPKILVTPHIAAMSLPGDVARVFWDNWNRWVDGRQLRFAVSLGNGY